MLTKVKKTSKDCVVMLFIDCILIAFSMILYFLYAQFNLLGFAIAFLVIGFTQIILRVIFRHLKIVSFNKSFLLGKDFILMVFVAFIVSLITLITKSFSLEYNKYILFNIFFISYVAFQICFDLMVGKNDD